MDDQIKLIRFMGEMEGYLRGLLMCYDLADDVYASIANKANEIQSINNQFVSRAIDDSVHTMD